MWWDAKLKPGDDYADKINEVLTTARVVVVLRTPAAAGSRWTRAEAEKGWSRGVLVPVQVRPTQIPAPFQSLHTLDLSAWSRRSDSNDLAPLLQAVKARLVSQPGERALTGPRPLSSVTAAQRRTTLLQLVAVVGLVAVVAIVLAWQAGPFTHATIVLVQRPDSVPIDTPRVPLPPPRIVSTDTGSTPRADSVPRADSSEVLLPAPRIACVRLRAAPPDSEDLALGEVKRPSLPMELCGDALRRSAISRLFLGSLQEENENDPPFNYYYRGASPDSAAAAIEVEFTRAVAITTVEAVDQGAGVARIAAFAWVGGRWVSMTADTGRMVPPAGPQEDHPYFFRRFVLQPRVTRQLRLRFLRSSSSTRPANIALIRLRLFMAGGQSVE